MSLILLAVATIVVRIVAYYFTVYALPFMVGLMAACTSAAPRSEFAACSVQLRKP